MPFWLVKPSTSAALKLPVIDTVAPDKVALSGSVTLMPLSITTATPSSVKAVGAALVVSTGASLTGVTAIVFVVAALLAAPSLALKETVLLVPGLSFVDENVTERSAVW